MKFFEKHLLTLHQFGIDSAPFMDKWIYEPNAVCWPISPRDCHFSYLLLAVVEGTVHVLGP